MANKPQQHHQPKKARNVTKRMPARRVLACDWNNASAIEEKISDRLIEHERMIVEGKSSPKAETIVCDLFRNFRDLTPLPIIKRGWEDFIRISERQSAHPPDASRPWPKTKMLKEYRKSIFKDRQLAEPPLCARVGRQVSETLRVVTFRHPELGRVEVFLEIADLPEGAVEGSTYDLTALLDENGRVVLSLPDNPNVKPPEPRKRLGPELPKFPEDPNDSEAMAKYDEAMRKLLPY